MATASMLVGGASAPQHGTIDVSLLLPYLAAVLGVEAWQAAAAAGKATTGADTGSETGAGEDGSDVGEARAVAVAMAASATAGGADECSSEAARGAGGGPERVYLVPVPTVPGDGLAVHRKWQLDLEGELSAFTAMPRVAYLVEREWLLWQLERTKEKRRRLLRQRASREVQTARQAERRAQVLARGSRVPAPSLVTVASLSVARSRERRLQMLRLDRQTPRGAASRRARAIGESSSAQAAQEQRIRILQSQIRQVEAQAAMRQVQSKLLEIKIRQVELMVLVRQAQQVATLRGREGELISRKTALEAKIALLQEHIAEQQAAASALAAAGAGAGGEAFTSAADEHSPTSDATPLPAAGARRDRTPPSIAAAAAAAAASPRSERDSPPVSPRRETPPASPRRD
ncbi:uncharacterized protein AMSG_04004 [Thecamonas trahens ATCC 50062]|uniref:Uncharacterized protein n=1 Tax=Thecamonas trahens ATCC 50062 TaxID=461836 RepID=A0A0L0D5W5_THETB|nr:hypothetical protein AMSG_04004 [Thecamonas trahens ATCC 50062]KNC47777.1 hypothetical protein AMSG_04004 [Thecamonas trahens ATCC 50062]|eukprot:XP_013759255.1 hypothetical protein AMSG_04004 [Thecamonas trahens ATCC 50062]